MATERPHMTAPSHVRYSALFNMTDPRQQMGAFVKKIALDVMMVFCVLVICVNRGLNCSDIITLINDVYTT